MSYQRYLTPETKPYNPIKLAKDTEAIVCLGDKRKYTDFYATWNPQLAKNLEEEVIFPYEITLVRLRYAKIDLKFPTKFL
jgi:hypothetical protein